MMNKNVINATDRGPWITWFPLYRQTQRAKEVQLRALSIMRKPRDDLCRPRRPRHHSPVAKIWTALKLTGFQSSFCFLAPSGINSCACPCWDVPLRAFFKSCDFAVVSSHSRSARLPSGAKKETAPSEKLKSPRSSWARSLVYVLWLHTPSW